MKIIKLKRILSLLIVFTLTFSINHNISIVKAEESVNFLTGVSLTDDKNNNLAGKKVKPDSKVSIVYTYEIGANNGNEQLQFN